MANGLREEIRDPLALGVEQQQTAQLQVTAPRAPVSSGAVGAGANFLDLANKLGQLGAAVQETLQVRAEDAFREGKMAYLQGKTETDLAKSGNNYTSMGYNLLKTQTATNQWFVGKVAELENDKSLDPASYLKKMGQDQADYLNSFSDPWSRKVASAQLEDFGPKLVEKQMESHSSWNLDRQIKEHVAATTSGSLANFNGPTRSGDSPLAISATPIASTMSGTASDREIGIRTMLGEAAGEGDTGLAAVAFVLKNRARDGGYGGKTISAVALADKQFSTWNAGAGGNNPQKWQPGTPAWEKAAKVYDAVMGGQVADMTGGATHYYAYGTIGEPTWFEEQKKKSGGARVIGGHIFAGKAANADYSDLASSAIDHAYNDSQTSPPVTGKSGEGLVPYLVAGKNAEHVTGMQEGLQTGLTAMFNDAPPEVKQYIKIMSGYRSPERQAQIYKAAVEKYKSEAEARKWAAPPGRSQHNHGNAADLSFDGSGTTSNVSASGKKAMEWVHENASKYGLAFPLSNEPWHVEVAGARNRDNGTSKPNTTYEAPNTPAYMAIKNSRLPPLKLAAAYTDAVSNSLNQGDTTLFDNLGGMAGLNSLGIFSSDQLNSIYNAHDRFEKKQDTTFNPAREQFSANIVERAKNGENPDVLIKDIDQHRKDLHMSDSYASALVRQALDKLEPGKRTSAILAKPEVQAAVNAARDTARRSYEAGDKSKYVTPEQSTDSLKSIIAANGGGDAEYQAVLKDFYSMQDSQLGSDSNKRVAAIEKAQSPDQVLKDPRIQRVAQTTYQRFSMELAAGHKIEPEQATKIVAEELAKLGLPQEKYGEAVNVVLGNMWDVQKQYFTKLMSEADTATKKYQAQSLLKQRLDNVLTIGSGLADLSGTYTMPNAQGKPVDMDVKDAAVYLIKEQATKETQAQIDQGKVGKDEATWVQFDKVYEALSKQGVPDKDFTAQVNGALRGDIVDQKTKEVSRQATMAFAGYMQMKNNPKITDDFINKQFPDKDTRTLLETARWLHDGGLDINPALMKAHTLLSNKDVQPAEKIIRDSKFTTGVEIGAKAAVDDLYAKGWLLDSTVPIKDADRQFLTRQQGQVQRAISDIADSYYTANPGTPPEVAISIAKDIVKGNLDQVGGNLLISHGGKTVGQTVGLNDPGALDTAMSEYLDRYGKGIPGWETRYEELRATARNMPQALDLDRRFGLPQWTQSGKTTPGYSAVYNPINNTVIVDLYTDFERTNTLGRPTVIPLKDVADNYHAERRNPSIARTVTTEAMRTGGWTAKYGYSATTGVPGGPIGTSPDDRAAAADKLLREGLKF